MCLLFDDLFFFFDTQMENISPVLEMYRMRLDWYTFQIRKLRWKFGDRIRGLSDTKRELELLIEILRPCLGVIRHLINDEGLAPSDDHPLVNQASVAEQAGQQPEYNIQSRLFNKAEMKQYFEDIDDTLHL